MESFVSDIWAAIESNVPRLVMAVLVLAGGWLVATLGAMITRGVLRRTSLDNRAASWVAGDKDGESPPVEQTAGKIVFWVLMGFAVVGFLTVLGLGAVASPLRGFLNEVFAYLPRLLSAGVLLFIAWLVATGLRFAISRGLGATRLDEKLGGEMAEGARKPSAALGETAYWLTFLVLLPAVLGALQLQGLLDPVNRMMGKLLAFLPNLFAAAVLLGIGMLVARVIQRIVTSALSAAGADALGDRVGLDRVFGDGRISTLLGFVVYVLIFIPMVIASLDALGLDALTAPASGMLDQLMSAIPQIFGAAIILAVAFLIARLVSDLVERLLQAAGFDGLLGRIGFSQAAEGTRSPSELVGWLAMAAIMLFATIEALEMLGFYMLAEIVTEFTYFAGDVLLAAVILAVGLYFASLAAGAIATSGTRNASALATGARVAIIVLASAMALRQAGLAEDIINLAFGLLLGAAAVAAAIAFGIGGRDLAARQLDKWTGGRGDSGGFGD